MRNTFIFDYEMAGVEAPLMHETGYNISVRGIVEPIFEEPPTIYKGPMRSPAGLGLPMLPPPKRFLLEGSKFYVSEDTIYNFFRRVRDRRPEHKGAVDVSSQKVRLHKDKIQLIKASWFFKRDVNVLAERKIGFHMLTYSAKSKGLYHIRSMPKSSNGRYRKQVRRVSLNKFGVDMSHYDSKHIKRWQRALYEMIKKDVPDVRDDCDNIQNSIIALIIQHRIGKGIQGLNDIFIENLGNLSSDNYHRQQICTEEGNGQGTDQEYIELCMRKRKRGTVYKFLPVLKETGSLNKAMKVLLGKHYSRMLVKIIYSIPISGLFRGGEDKFIAGYNTDVPNGVKHLLAKHFKDNQHEEIEALLSQIARMLTDVEYDRTISKDIIVNWAKTMNRLGDLINWIAWKDIYSMSAQLGLRVRPSRFESTNDVRNLHNEYSRLIGATNQAISNVPRHALMFLEVDTPDELGDFIIKQMVSQDDLDIEGDMMSHCVASYGNKCMRGASVIVSIRDKATNKRLYTVEYAGKNFTLIQAQGYDNASPDKSLEDTLFGLLANALRNGESKKPLSYQMRASFRFKQLNIMYGLEVIEDSNLAERDIERHLEMINCGLERLAHINTLINSPNPPSNKELVELASKIDVEAADELMYQHRRSNIGNNTQLPAWRVPEGLLPPAPAPHAGLNLNGNNLELDPVGEIEEPVNGVHHNMPF